MNEYIHPNGYTYTEDELISAAKKENMTLEEFISNRGIKPKKKKEKVFEEVTTEVPGKPKPVVKKDAVATAKDTASKSVKPSSVSSNNAFGDTKMPDPLGLESLRKPKKDIIAERIDRWNKTGQSKKSIIGPKDKDYGDVYLKDDNKIGDYLTSTLRTKKATEAFFSAEEDEGKDTLEKLYAGIPGLTFEKTSLSKGTITNIFDAVKAVYTDPLTNKRVESEPLAFDVGGLFTTKKTESTSVKNNIDILRDFFNKNLKNVNLAKNQALREESKLIYNKELNNAITPEFREEINIKFDAPDLFTPRVESYKSIQGSATMGASGGGTYIFKPYENELNLAKKQILANNPKISKQELDIEANKLARTLLKTDAINNKKASVAEKIIENDRSLQSKLYVGSLLSNEEAIKEQNKSTAQLKVAENTALVIQGLAKDSYSIFQGNYKSEEEANAIANKFKTLGIEINPNDTELITLKNGNTVSKSFYNAYLKLNDAYKANNLYASQIFNKQNKNLEKISDANIFATAASKNYDLSEKYLANVGVGTTDILAGATYFASKVLTATNPLSYIGDEISELIYGEDAQTISGKLDEWAVKYTNAADNIRQSYVRDVSFEDAFKNGSNFGKFAAQEISQQIPIIMAMVATGGAAGVAGVSAEGASTAMIGSFGAGSKMAQMQTEIAKGTADYSNAEIWLKSVGFGASEALFERVTTIPILKKATTHFAKVGGEDVLDNSMKAYFKSKTPGFVFDQFLESAGEVGTTITQNIIDGKPIMDNVAHAGFSGFGMGTIISGVPYNHGLYLSAFSNYNSKEEIRKLNTELKDLGKQFELTKKRAEKKVIAKLMDNKQNEINIAIEKQQNIINENLRSDAAQGIIKIENNKAKLQNEAKDIINDKSINDDLKETLIKDLRLKFNFLNNLKEQALNPNNLMQDKSKFILLEANQPERYNNLINQATISLGKKGIVTDEIIKKEAYDLYLKEEIDINIENAGKVEGAILNAYDTRKEAIAAAKINADTEKANNISKIDSINKDKNLTDSEKANQIKALEDSNVAIDNEFDIISTEINAGADGYKSASGIQVVVKENMLENQRTQIATHEVGHYVFDKIFLNNEKAFIPIANQLLLTTQKLDKKLYDKLIKNTEKDSQGNFKAAEVISRFLEIVSSGDISFAEKKNSFLSGLFGSMIQKEFIDQYDFDFKGQTDMFNFVVGLGKKIKSGELTLREIQEASESNVVKTAIELAKTKTYSKLVADTDLGPSFSKAKVAEIEDKIDKLEDRYDNDDIEYDDYVDRLAKLQEELKKAQALPEVEVKPKVEKPKVEISAEDEVKEIIKNDKGSVSSDKVQQIYETKGLNGTDEIIKLFRPITNKIVNKRKDAPGFDEDLLRDEIETGEGGILYLIRSYKPEKGVPLAAYINKQLPLRAIATSRRVLDQDFKKDVTEEKGLMAAETVSEVKEKPKYKNALESKVFSPEILETATKKILSIIRTLKSRIDAPVTLNRTVTPLIAEIRDEVGKMLDIDIKTMLGGKKDGVLIKELLRTKRYILENMTTTWLMGKDGQGGIPQAIQKQIDGKWVNYPDWVGQKIDREKTTTDQAGRTSGAELVRRLPNVANNISDEVFLSQIIGPDGNPIRGRKESLSKAMAEEGAFDIINNDLENQGPIYEALATNQTRLGYEMANNFVVNFVKQSERGNVKFSKKLENAQDVLQNLPKEVKSELIGLDGNKLSNFIKTVLNSEEVLFKFDIAYKDNYFKPEDKNKIINAIEGIYSFYEEKSETKTPKNYGINVGEDFLSFVNRKIFNALSKDQSLALTLNIPNSNLQWKAEDSRIAAQKEIKDFHKSAIEYFSKTMSINEANKLFTKLFSRAFGYGKDQSLFDNQEGFFNAFLKDLDGFKLGAGEVKGRTILYKNEKVNSSIGAFGQATSAKDISDFIKTGKPNKINFKERKNISTEAKKDLEKMITSLKDMYDSKLINNTQLGLIFKSLGGSMNSPLKLASELRYVAEKGNYSSDTKEWVYEHNPPTSYISRIAIGIIIGKTDMTIDEFMNKLINNSYVTILPKSFDKSVNEIYKSNMPFYYEIGNNPLTRYLDAGFNGKEVPSFYDLQTNKKISNAVLKDEFSSPIARDSQEAVKESLIQFSKAPKGISVFDFDDTIGLTKSKVLYTMPDGSTGKLDGVEFAKEGARLLDEGAIFDFSEFSKVIDGKPGPMVDKMKKMIGKFGPNNFFILTARPADSAVPIYQFLQSIGIDIPLENIIGLGNSTAQAKADWMTAKAAEGYNDFYFTDDAIQNVEAVKKALQMPGVNSKIQQARLKFSLTSKQDLKWKQGDEDLSTKFTVGNIDYRISMIETAYMEYDDDVQQILFDLVKENNLDEDTTIAAYDGEAYNLEFWDKKQGNGITGTGNAAEVFGIVINGVTDRIKKKNIEALVFTAKEPSRIKLYNSMAEVVADKLGWGAYYKDGVYILSKKPKTIGSTIGAGSLKPVKDVLNVVDIKSPINQARAKFSKTISPEFNKIIEENTGMESYKVFSDIVARRRGAGKNKFDFYVPPSAADFELLLYNFIGKGTRGEEQQEFFANALLKPYANGTDLMDAARQSIKRDYKALLKQFPDIKKELEKLTPDEDFTYDQAIRVAMWTEEEVEIPGISQRDQRKLTDLVNNDPELNAFKEALIVTGRQGKGWVKPTEYWDASTIISDLHNLTEGEGRKKFLGEFIENVEEMFGKFENGKLVGPNINKIEAVYGTNVREALEDQLYRMINGKNKSYGQDKETSRWSDWVNGSTGAIMFLNTRSAALQLLGAVNFLNLRDNNPFAAAKAFANQKQYWEDFSRIWNSDKMKERRGGLKEDVAAAEIANAAAGAKNKVNAVISYLLKVGYTPTQLADSFAIASGGAPFYRNRIKTYLKEGQTQEEAEANAWSDFTKVSDETQQSGDPRDISKQQASPAGRLLLTFQNFSMQQARIVKKSFLDLKNGRGDAKTHVTKIVYYLTVQNVLFTILQQGLFATLFDEDDEDKDKDKKAVAKRKTNTEKAIGVADDVLDTILRGTGFLGGIVSVLKNMYLKYRDEEEKDFKADYTKVVLEGANISPPIGSKLRKLYSGFQQTKFEKDLIKERGWGVMQDGRVHLGPMYGVTGKLVESTTNVPMDRLVNKIENISQALNSQNQAWQRIAVGVGFTPYSVGIEESEGDKKIRAKAKEERKEASKIKAKETRQRKKDSIMALPIEEIIKIRREEALKRREKILKKRKMG